MLEKISEILWGPVTILIILAAGVFCNVKTGFFPFTHAKSLVKATLLRKRAENEKISSFSALSTALSGCIGVGNIVGVATAIYIGGAGCVFWMWVSALLSMMIKFSEVSLAVRYRVTNGKEYFGGPMYYLRDGLKSKPLAVIYAAFGFASAIGVGTIVQSNTVSAALDKTFGVPPAVCAAVLAVFSAALLLGKSERVFKLSSIMCPLMVTVYLAACAVIICLNLSSVPECFSSIFKGAFGIDAVAGGAVGSAALAAMRSGFSKSIFSNEAGVGTSSIAHAKAHQKSPEVQGMWGVIEVFVDTIVVCTVTAISLLCCGACKGRFGIEATVFAFESAFGFTGNIILAVSVCAFAVSTIAAWTFYGKEMYSFLLGGRLSVLYPVIFVAFVVLGSLTEMKKVWTLTEVFNALAMFPNLIGVVALMKQTAGGLRLYVHNNR